MCEGNESILTQFFRKDYDQFEIETVMQVGTIFGHKNSEGTLVSSAAIIPYESKLASIGMVIVSSQCRGLGLGREVTEACIKATLEDTTLMLIATDEGRPLYERLGFAAVERIHKHLCDDYKEPESIPSMDVTIEELRSNDFRQLVQLDEGAMGVRRSRFLKQRTTQANQSLVAKDKAGNVIGYGLSILGPIHLIIGPIVAPNHEIACLILDRLACQHKGKLRMDVPSGHHTFLQHLQRRGFTEVNTPPVMAKQSAYEPRRNGTLFAIAAQVFG
nr:GNAT family N-acetyltransferase [Halalkalibacterium halodurans]